MGVANDHSIAWIVAAAAHCHGATLAFTYQGDSFGKRLRPLAASVGSDIVMPCDVERESDLDAVFETLAKRWGRLDFVVHAIAYSNREELKGRYVDTTWPNFARTLAISCYSFTAIAKRAGALADGGASLLTFTFSIQANELIILALQGCFQRNPHFGFVINNQYFFGSIIFHQNPHPNRES